MKLITTKKHLLDKLAENIDTNLRKENDLTAAYEDIEKMCYELRDRAASISEHYKKQKLFEMIITGGLIYLTRSVNKIEDLRGGN